MGIRRFTYTLRSDVADVEVMKAAEKHALEWSSELNKRRGIPAGCDYSVSYEVSPSLPIVQWGQLYYTITITLRGRLVGL